MRFMHKLEFFLFWAALGLTVPTALGTLMLLLFRSNTP
jgi:hypothetical protein